MVLTCTPAVYTEYTYLVSEDGWMPKDGEDGVD